MLTSMLVSLARLLARCGNSADQKDQSSTSATPKKLSPEPRERWATCYSQSRSADSCNPSNHRWRAVWYPRISSRAVRFDGSAFAPPREQNPGGPKQVYRFTAAAEGEAQIRIPHTDSNPAVTFTIQATKS